jgi:deoxycytidylate deaminase
VIPPLTLILAPELVIGLVAPIGVDLDIVTKSISRALAELNYRPIDLRITTLMRSVPVELPLAVKPFIQSYKDRIAYANAVRGSLGDDALAALAITALRAHRHKSNVVNDSKTSDDRDSYRPLSGHAYILRQFKRPEEIILLRRVYGRQFILISAYAPPDLRKSVIAQKEARSGSTSSPVEIENNANELVAQDSKESHSIHGQNVRDAFPLADVIVDAATQASCEPQVKRFFQLLFGSNKITPTRDEYGMYLAKSAALRTADLSRQVGAAIFSPSGESIALGTNEVPKPGGGTYWTDDSNDRRDWVQGYDPNDQRQTEILIDVIHRLRESGHLTARLVQMGQPQEIVTSLLAEKGDFSLRDSMVMDILEFGRIIHAEMCAITDAARKGVSIHQGVLYCTTFPCHICAKHIVASGLGKVVYLEPYSKSYASRLHSDSIIMDGELAGKVSFKTFIGISPYRYRDLFERRDKRKEVDGSFREWISDPPRPNIELYYPSYREAEERVAASFNISLLETFPPGLISGP